MHEAHLFAAADLRAGIRAEFERDITEGDIKAFAELSGDWNPLHISKDYARQTNYSTRIVHGAFQVALASTMAGMYLPGREVVVASFQCRFPAPLTYPSRVRVSGEITAWVPDSVSGTLRVRLVDLSSNILTSEIHVGFSLHEKRAAVAAASVSRQTAQEDKPLVLVTGGSGGIGKFLSTSLSSDYAVIGLSRSLPVTSAAAAEQNVEWAAADLSADDWEDALTAQLRGRRLFGCVHAAWPAAPQGSLLDSEPSAVAAQVEFGSAGTIRIARFLRSHAAPASRLVILGTTAATIDPVMSMSAYSLGKATLEHAVRLLAPELARSNITINIVAPSFIPVGMNSSKTNRVILTETAKVPLGKLCSPDDVAEAVRFFLSPGSAFVTGQILPLTGGKL